MNDTYITSKISNKFAQIMGEYSSKINLNNVTFQNINSTYAPALYLDSCFNTIINSKFINLTGSKTAGAIGIKNGANTYIDNCEFINTSSSKNAGAIYADITGMQDSKGNVTITNTLFENTYSVFGGAYMQLGGQLIINNSNFTNNGFSSNIVPPNKFAFNGGAIYLSFADATINNCIFDSNSVSVTDGYPTYGGAIYSDYCNLTLTDSKFINNTAFLGNAIYACDSNYNISGTTFENNTNAIFTHFDFGSYLDNNTNIYNNDSVSLNNTFYQTIVCGSGMGLELLNNGINITTLPSKFDLRDWGWVSDIKNQGLMGSCWTFGMISSVESALLKAYGISTNLSENNMQNTMLRYSQYGYTATYEFGLNTMAISYLLSWLGVHSEDMDSYDELGKISPIIMADDDIHIQDVIFISNAKEYNGSLVKAAILKYGALDGAFYGQTTAKDEVNPYFNPETYAEYVNESIPANHEISIIGWDDNFSADKFNTRPDGDGAWIIKNSMGKEWGDNGIVYVSYYDKTLSISTDIGEWTTGIIIENNVHYTKNYQRDMCWNGEFVYGENISYANEFIALSDDLIAAVGTYFESPNVSYTVEIYVNNELKLTQEGVSPYYGFHTIKLNKYIPIKAGDDFYAVLTSNAVPICHLNETRVHSTNGFSYVYKDGDWTDLYDENQVACLKIYTVDYDTKIINNEDIAIDYDTESYFSVCVVTADGHSVGDGETVTFTINVKTTETITDNESIARVKIVEVPGTYIITTTYAGKNYENNVSIKLNPKRCKIIDNKDITVDYNSESYFSVKIVSADGKIPAAGVNVNFIINGKTHTATTDANGVAKIQITEKAGTYTITTMYQRNITTNTIAVKEANPTTKPNTSTNTKTSKKSTKIFAKKKTFKSKVKVKKYTVTLKSNRTPLKKYTVTLKIKGKKYTSKTNNKGKATFKIIKLNKKGTYTATINYKGNNKYKTSKKTVKIIIK